LNNGEKNCFLPIVQLMQMSNHSIQLSRYVTTFPCPDKPGRVLLLATRSCAILELSEGMWAAVRGGNEITENNRETLVELGVMVSDRDVERSEILETFNRANARKRPFTALVTLTLECNLACPYCFEDPFRGRFVMSDATAKELVSFLIRKMADGLDVKVDFYGGEALLALPRLKEIAGHLHEAAQMHGVSFCFGIITNGTLLSRTVVQELIPIGLNNARLTLDGPPDIHNRQRPFASGAESFDVILRNVRDTCELLQLELGGNYTRENYHRFPEMLDILLQTGIRPDALSAVGFFPVFPKADGSKSSECTTACAGCDEPWMIEAGLFLREEAMRRGFPVPKLRTNACMVEFENDLVVNYDGSLYKCPAFMGNEELRIGSLTEGIKDYRESHSLDVWKNDECLDCAYLPLCFGGCRFLRRLKTGAIDGVDCRKALLDESLERIVRQDLKFDHPQSE